ncbi:MAG: helix-hairpin-helix domain-containing protein [Gammaproteobacteria bacterium]
MGFLKYLESDRTQGFTTLEVVMKITSRFIALVALLLTGLTTAAHAIDINSASADEIAAALKGVGPKQAAAIVEYRTQHGPFKSIDDLSLVKGIGEKTIANNRAMISLDAPAMPESATAAMPAKPTKQAMPEPATAAIPAKPMKPAMPESTAASATTAIDINSASADEIAAALKGVGPKQAAAIVEYRAQHGPFKSIDDLSQIKGIGEKTIANNRDLITLASPAAKPMKAKPAEETAMAGKPKSSNTASDLININTASAKELDDGIKGVGPVLAARIVKYREENGPFKSIDDLVNVKGIGPATLDKIRGQITDR